MPSSTRQPPDPPVPEPPVDDGLGAGVGAGGNEEVCGLAAGAGADG